MKCKTFSLFNSHKLVPRPPCHTQTFKFQHQDVSRPRLKSEELQVCQSQTHNDVYSVSQKNPPCGFLTFFPNGWEFFDQFLLTYYTFLSTLDYKFLFNYLQLWRSYAIL